MLHADIDAEINFIDTGPGYDRSGERTGKYITTGATNFSSRPSVVSDRAGNLED